MSTITPTTVLDGALVSTDVVNGNFDLLHEVNGKLDAVNLDMDRTITYEQIQHRALSGGRTVAGTANLDYFNGVRYGIFGPFQDSQAEKMNLSLRNYLFLVTNQVGLKERGLVDKGLAGDVESQDTASRIDYTFKNADATESASPIALPGASISFFLPYAARVLVTWQVTWTSDAARHGEGPNLPPTGTRVTDEQAKDFPQPNTAVRFFLDGSEYNKASLTRESREAMFTQPAWTSTGAFHPHALRDRYKSRYWSGHAFLGQSNPLAKGFHTASLRVASGRNVRQMRVRARSMKVMYFKA